MDTPKTQVRFGRQADRFTDLVEVETPLQDGWYLAATYSTADGELELVELKVFPGGERERFYEWEQDPDDRFVPLPDPGVWRYPDALDGVRPGGISAATVRAIRVGDLEATVRMMTNLVADDGGRWAAVADIVSGLPKANPGRAGQVPTYYVPYAVAYDEAVSRGSRSPVADAAEKLGVKRSVARDMVHEARKRGLLTGGGLHAGKGGGRLTEYALELIEQED